MGHQSNKPPTRLAIHPPVDVFSRLEDVLAWQRELADLRAQHDGDHRAVVRIAREEGYADHLVDLIQRRPVR